MDADLAIQKIREIRDGGYSLTDWEVNFLDDLQSQADDKIAKYPRGAYISARQADKLNQIFDEKVDGKRRR